MWVTIKKGFVFCYIGWAYFCIALPLVLFDVLNRRQNMVEETGWLVLNLGNMLLFIPVLIFMFTTDIKWIWSAKAAIILLGLLYSIAIISVIELLLRHH